MNDACFHDLLAETLVQRLLATEHTIVFAESCTAGLIAAHLGRIAGASGVLAGSAVVYQLATKSAWLDVSSVMLEDSGAVSQPVSEQMACGALARTPQASMAASVTGHLGPNAPPDLDGVAWSTVALRRGDRVRTQSRRLSLQWADASEGKPMPPADASVGDDSGLRLRRWRQLRATELVLQFCVDVLDIETRTSAGSSSEFH